MSFSPYNSMLDQMTPEQLKLIASGQTGDVIAQYAAVKALRDRAQIANAMNAANQPQQPQPTVLENAVNQAKLAQVPQVGPNNTGQAIPTGIAAIARAQGKGLQAGGRIAPSEQPTRAEREEHWSQRVPAVSPNVRERINSGEAVTSVLPGIHPGNMLHNTPSGMTPYWNFAALEADNQMRRAGVGSFLPDVDTRQDLNLPEQSAEEMINSIFGDTPSVGGSRIDPSRYGVDLSDGPPELSDSIEEIRDLFPSGEKNRARRRERIDTLEKEGMQENAFQRSIGIAMMGLGIASRGWGGAQRGLEAISAANTANRQQRMRLAEMSDRIEDSEVEEARASFNQAMNAFNAARADYRHEQGLAVGIDQFNANMGMRAQELNVRLSQPERELRTMASMLYAASQGTEHPLTEQEAVRQAIVLGVSGSRGGRQNAPDDLSEITRLAIALTNSMLERDSPEYRTLKAVFDAAVRRARTQTGVMALDVDTLDQIAELEESVNNSNAPPSSSNDGVWRWPWENQNSVRSGSAAPRSSSASGGTQASPTAGGAL